MRVKTASTLISFPFGNKIATFNYLTKSSVVCGASDLRWLTEAPDWTEEADIARRYPETDFEAVQTTLHQLRDLGLMIAENSAEAEQDAAYYNSWKMDRASAFLHFLVMDNPFVSTEESIHAQMEQAKTDPSPPLFRPNGDSRIALPAADGPILDVMRRRRTNRIGLEQPVSLTQLGACLWAGLGITGFVRTEASLLPLKMTPSGGARNPFEAYVFARDVTGLAPGIYHYAAIDHSLGPVSADLPVSFGELLAGQPWADTMPAMIVLVASLDRTSWKYKEPNAYRVVLIEAGHIGQNIMLAATNNDLTACPTAALAHTLLRTLLRIESMTEVPLYALAVGHPGCDPDQVVTVQDYLEGTSK